MEDAKPHTATAITTDHYSRPNVKETIIAYCTAKEGERALNSDSGWYEQGANKDAVRLTACADYDTLTKKYRTLYATLDHLARPVFDISMPWDNELHKPEHPIGTLGNCMAYTLSVDIDGVGDIHHPVVKAAVERAGQFFVDYLRDNGINKSVGVLFSGGGIYVHVHPALFTANPDWSEDEREQVFRSLAMAFNRLIADVETDFFLNFPEYAKSVKFDKLNNQKRKFKCIFSIHKKHPYAVIPLDPRHIEIDFERAKVPISDTTIESGATWGKEYDLDELPRLKKILGPYEKQARADLKERKDRAGSFDLTHRDTPLSEDEFAPCMKNIIEKTGSGAGKHRALAVLASYLYQVGWDDVTAFELWSNIALRGGVEPRIFDVWYGQMLCPSCETIKKTGGGYPAVGLGGLGYCEDCGRSTWPGQEQEAGEEEEVGEKILELLEKLPEKTATDPGASFENEALEALATIKTKNPAEWQRVRLQLKNAGVRVGDLDTEVNSVTKKTNLPTSIVLKNIQPTRETTHAMASVSKLVLPDVADIDHDERGGIKSAKFNPDKAVDALCQHLHILSTPDKIIWVYEDGYFRPDGEVVIDQIFDRLAGNLYTMHVSRETLKKVFLRTWTPFEELDSHPFLMCVQNGVVDLENDKFLPHSPEYRMTLPCPVTYDPAAIPWNNLKFYQESCNNDDDRMTLVDWMIACACLTEFEFLLFLTGHGGNGKRVYEAVLRNMFGSNATEAISLDELSTSTFAMGNLRQARLCVSTETNPTKATTEMIKKISGNDWLSCDVKNKSRVRFVAFTQLVFDTNSMPVLGDSSVGFARRFTQVKMPFFFTDNPKKEDPQEKKKIPGLADLLSTEEEKSGLLNLMMLRAPHIIPSRSIHRREKDLEGYEKQAMSATDFIEQFLDIQDEYRGLPMYNVSSDMLYKEFLKFQKLTIGAEMTRKSFSRLVGKYSGESTRAIRPVGSEVAVRGFRGIGFEQTKFNAFVKEQKRLYTTSSSNDLVTISKDNRYSINDSSGDGVTICNDVTIYSEFVKVLVSKCNSVEYSTSNAEYTKNEGKDKIVTKNKDQQQEATKNDKNPVTMCRSESLQDPNDRTDDVKYNTKDQTTPIDGVKYNPPHTNSATTPNSLNETISECERTSTQLAPETEAERWGLTEFAISNILHSRGWAEVPRKQAAQQPEDSEYVAWWSPSSRM